LIRPPQPPMHCLPGEGALPPLREERSLKHIACRHRTSHAALPCISCMPLRQPFQPSRQYSLCCCCAAVAPGLVVAAVECALQGGNVRLRRQHDISAVHLQVQHLQVTGGRRGGGGGRSRYGQMPVKQSHTAKQNPSGTACKQQPRPEITLPDKQQAPSHHPHVILT
jgi:hypothetical protein